MSITSIFQPSLSDSLEYILKRSPAKMLASSPPAPALISRYAEPSSAESFGSNINFNSFSNFSGLSSAFLISSSAKGFKSLSPDSIISLASEMLFIT